MQVRDAPLRGLLTLTLLAGACARTAEPRRGGTVDAGSALSLPLGPSAGVAGGADAPLRLTLPGDPDGDDDEEDPGSGHAPSSARWEKVGTPPLGLTRVCDLTPLGGALYAAHANQPLGSDGATITRYDPRDERRPFRVAFDWNRPGEPTTGGGGGQGFLRVHAIGGRLYVPDADPPYGGLGLVDWGTEGYVFVSSPEGAFAPPRAPHFRPPGPPELRVDADGGPRPGAGVLPRAYHVIDAIRYRGALYASTGSVPPTERAWKGPAPGALHRASEDGARWTYEVDYPFPYRGGTYRLTYLVRFRGRLYAGIQDYDGRDPNDFVVFDPPAPADGGASVLRREDATPTRITRTGASGTLRWWVDTRAKPHRLYWLAWTRDGIALRVTTDGDHWYEVAFPDEAGPPADVKRFRDAVVVLTARGLYRLTGDAVDGPRPIGDDGVAHANATVVAPVDGKERRSPFDVTDFFCAAPIAVLDGTLYAGGQRGGALYRLVE